MANTLQDILAWMQNPQQTQQMQGVGGLFSQAINKLQINREEANNLWAQAFQDPTDPLKVTNPEAFQKLTEMSMSGVLGFAPAGMIGTRFKGAGAVPTDVPGFGAAKEIQDIGSSINPEKIKEATDWFRKQDVMLGDILSHPALYRDYPELAKYPVKSMGLMQSRDLSGAYADGKLYLQGNLKNLNDEKLKSVHSTLLHEIQHAIQQLDNMPGGGMPSEFLSPSFFKNKTKIEKISSKATDTLNEQLEKLNIPIARGFDLVIQNKTGKELLNQYPELAPFVAYKQKASKVYFDVTAKENEAFKKYKALAGEAQSRAVQKRFENPQEYSKPVTQSYDVPVENLFYRDPFGNPLK